MAEKEKAGTKGSPVDVYTNMFRIRTLPRRDFYHYDGKLYHKRSTTVLNALLTSALIDQSVRHHMVAET